MVIGVHDYYATLGVDASASPEAIKRAYRKRAKQYHPDANKTDPGAEEQFKRIAEAYDVLADPARRAEYDAARHSQFGSEASWRDAGDWLRSFQHLRAGWRVHRSSRSSAFAESVFVDGPASDASDEEPTTVGSDVHATLSLPRELAQRGGRTTFRLPGWRRRITVTIPKGTRDGQCLRLARQGRLCGACRHAGDLLLTITMRNE